MLRLQCSSYGDVSILSNEQDGTPAVGLIPEGVAEKIARAELRKISRAAETRCLALSPPAIWLEVHATTHSETCVGREDGCVGDRHKEAGQPVLGLFLCRQVCDQGCCRASDLLAELEEVALSTHRLRNDTASEATIRKAVQVARAGRKPRAVGRGARPKRS